MSKVAQVARIKSDGTYLDVRHAKYEVDELLVGGRYGR